MDMIIETSRLLSVILTMQFAYLLAIRAKCASVHFLNFKFVSFCSFSSITIS